MQDTMGFAVVGPDHFFASGHPDFAVDDEPLMGLIESRDAGATWQVLSLRGQADFHALQVVDDQVFGFDATSGTFMVSQDGTRWARRSQVPLRDFAVAPGAPEPIVGTTPEGVVSSSDGGRSWQPLAGAPPLVVIDATADALIGVDVDGLVHVSVDGGASWERRGSAGASPAAMTVTEDGQLLHVATERASILISNDGGRTFSTAYAS